MKLSADAVIARGKLVHYLLAWRAENDKSRYLASAGYTVELTDRLASDLRRQLLPLNAEFLETTDYGDKYQIRGRLTGPNGQSLEVASIWMIEHATGLTKFITLYPARI